MQNSKKLLIYTDASFKDKCGGWGAVIVNEDKFNVVGGKVSSFITNSGSSEFFAIYKSLLYIIENFKQVEQVTFNTDHFGIVSSFKRYIRNKQFNGVSINKGLIILIFNLAKKHNIFINTNHVKGHQSIATKFPTKTFNNLKKADRSAMITYHDKIRRQQRKFSSMTPQIYLTLKKIGWNRSAIFNTMADSKSKTMRKRHSRNNNFFGFCERTSVN
jgi:ribonuclease HI